MWQSQKQIDAQNKVIMKHLTSSLSDALMAVRQNDYFNDKDYFLLYDAGLGKFISTMVHLYNGSWYSNVGLQYKMTSVLCVNCSHLRVNYSNK